MQKKNILLVAGCLAAGFFAGMEFRAYQVRKAISDGLGQLGAALATPSTEAASNQLAVDNIIKKPMNEEVVLRSIKYRVNGSDERDAITSQFGSPVFAKQGTKFIVVDMGITNLLNGEFAFYPDDGFALLDNHGRQFKTYENTIGNIDNYLNVRDLSPGVEESGLLVYEIPADSTSYSLIVGKSGTDEVYSVLLR